MFLQFLLNSSSLNFLKIRSEAPELLRKDRQTDNAKHVDAFHFVLLVNTRKDKLKQVHEICPEAVARRGAVRQPQNPFPDPAVWHCG